MLRLSLVDTLYPEGPRGAALAYADRPDWMRTWEATGMLTWQDLNGDGRIQSYAGDSADFVAEMRSACVTPHVAQKARHSAIDGRTTRHEGYALSIKHRKRIEEAFGWAKTVGGMAQTVYRGVERVRSRFILTMAANNLARLPRLLAA